MRPYETLTDWELTLLITHRLDLIEEAHDCTAASSVTPIASGLLLEAAARGLHVMIDLPAEAPPPAPACYNVYYQDKSSELVFRWNIDPLQLSISCDVVRLLLEEPCIKDAWAEESYDG